MNILVIVSIIFRCSVMSLYVLYEKTPIYIKNITRFVKMWISAFIVFFYGILIQDLYSSLKCIRPLKKVVIYFFYLISKVWWKNIQELFKIKWIRNDNLNSKYCDIILAPIFLCKKVFALEEGICQLLIQQDK